MIGSIHTAPMFEITDSLFLVTCAIITLLLAVLLRMLFERQSGFGARIKGADEMDWHALVEASEGVITKGERKLLDLCHGNRHLLHFVGRTIHFCVTRGHSTFVFRLISHLQREKWRERRDGLLETTLNFSFDADDEDYQLIRSCLVAMLAIKTITSFIPVKVCDMLIQEVIREKVKTMIQQDDENDYVLEQIIQSTTIRIRSYLRLLGLADGTALSQPFWERNGSDDILVEWKDRLVQVLSATCHRPDDHLLQDVVFACRIFPSFLVQIRRFYDAQWLLRNERFCILRSEVLGGELGTKQHIDDLKMLLSSSQDALVTLDAAVIENSLLTFSYCLPDDGDALYGIGCFLFQSKKPLACIDVLEEARWIFHQRLEAPLTLVADALEYLGTLYLVHDEEGLYYQYYGAAKSLRTVPDVLQLYGALEVYCKFPIRPIESPGLIFRVERLLARLLEANIILNRLLLTLQAMTDLPTDPDIFREESLVATCSRIIDGIPVPSRQSNCWWKGWRSTIT